MSDFEVELKTDFAIFSQVSGIKRILKIYILYLLSVLTIFLMDISDHRFWTFPQGLFLFFYVYTLNKIINVTLLFFPPFSWAELKDLRLFSMYTKGQFISNIVHKSV